jgi:hypothetical protein
VRAIPETMRLSRAAARARAGEHCSERTMVDAYVDTYRRLTRTHRDEEWFRHTRVTL